MTYHYHINCDFCGKGVDDWDGVPEDWVTLNGNEAINRPEHACPECWQKVLKVLEMSKPKTV